MYIRFLKVQPMKKWSQKRTIMRRYNLTARMYEMRYAEEQAAKYKVALEHLHLNRDSIVLDVGCGTGLLFSQVASEVQTVIGVDISNKLLRQAKERSRGLPKIQLIQADADNLPFKNNNFSIIFAFTVLQNMPNPLETLREIKRNATCTASVVVTGLKKVFSLEAFQALLQDAGLNLVFLENANELKCHVAVTVQN